VLAAEDNAVNKNLIPRPLEKAGSPVDTADDGVQAVHAMAGHQVSRPGKSA